ncbi:MAG: hypothetical protein LZF86_10180 [Nitrospira sp.]|nr:MAG: hypothetical protein LZF86_10180 [Nitrospira sp.]
MAEEQPRTSAWIMNRQRQSGSILIRWRGVATVCLVVAVFIAMAASPSSYADEPFPAAVASYPTGKITSIHETTFQIDGRTVSLAPEAVLVDRHGDPLPPAALRVDIDVRYHIQKGTIDKIDWMLLILPE